MNMDAMTKRNEVVRVAAGDFSREPGRYQDLALTRAVIVTRNGRDRTVMISVEEYDRLKRRDREVLGIKDFSEDDIEAIRQSRAPAETAALNRELKA
jgi:PHD/YefM family antitoxin component YafN of YafNO toxin-antitoxin module